MEWLNLPLADWSVRYYPRGARVSGAESVARLVPEEDELLADHERLRRIVVRFFPGRPAQMLYLHWSNGADLNALDQSVAAGAAGKEEFSGALPAQATSIRCQACGASSRVVMATPGTPFFDDETERLRTHRYIEKCPNCDVRWTVNVLEIVPTGGTRIRREQATGGLRSPSCAMRTTVTTSTVPHNDGAGAPNRGSPLRRSVVSVREPVSSPRRGCRRQ
ncbi:hypothetical protein [Streptomyces litchfieldiae]|uniref:Uncharacterized protein n=1 Tax=Streptomyces litchfieldiae TaxID=3075543 RepID=A0ABU2MMY4_9ACTN|nr:hypothetical protein [Streptomyces sp. DSM 44938]MDT0342910.1 hypothetical protein [Streptomyces sp. DSM 44938]